MEMTKFKHGEHIEIVITRIADMDIMSSKTCKMVYDVLCNHYRNVEVTVIKEHSDLEKLVQKHPDIVFSGIKYVGFTEDAIKRDSPDKIWLSGYLDKYGINYTGSNEKALKLEFEKNKAKKKMQENGVRTSSYFVAQPGQFQCRCELPLEFPLFIKPMYEGNGKYIGPESVVFDFESFEKQVEVITRDSGTSVLVEKYLGGREFTICVIDAGCNDLIPMPIELIAVPDSRGNRILGLDAKTDDNEQRVVVNDKNMHEELSAIAKKAFRVLGARDYGRIDIRMDADGTPYFLEANLMPGLKVTSYFSSAYEMNDCLSYEDIILRIVAAGLQRGPKLVSHN